MRALPTDAGSRRRLVVMVMSLALLAWLLLPPVRAQEEPSPQPTGPQIKLLNPSPGYNPDFGNEMNQDPKISDKFDGIDARYHLVAWVANTPSNPSVQAFIDYGDGAQPIGDLRPIGGGTWHLFWDIPADFDEGSATISVTLFSGTTSRAQDAVEVDMQHKGEEYTLTEQPADETVEITWPRNRGVLGFYNGQRPVWRTVVSGSASQFTSRVQVAYSVSKPGTQPEFTFCGEFETWRLPEYGNEPIPFHVGCALETAHKPRGVRAIAVVANEEDEPTQSTFFTQEAADVHTVRDTYIQDPHRMRVQIASVPPTSPSAAWPTGARRVAGSDCLEFDATVIDHRGARVQGANVDVHVSGPTDDAGIGIEASTTLGSSQRKAPDKGGHKTGEAWDCDSPGDRTSTQGEHDRDAAADRYHVEATNGSGLSGPSRIQPGQFRFHVFSPDPGFQNIRVWVDDKDLPRGEESRPPDNDRLDRNENSAGARAQWFPGPMRVVFEPLHGSARTGTCIPYALQVRADRTVVPGINVDVHAAGPDDQLDFCRPRAASGRSAPVLGDHTAEDRGEASHLEQSPANQHTEGQTNRVGNFVFGLRSPTPGETKLSAWVDGERGEDDDVFNSREINTSSTLKWGGTAEEATVRFVNPSGYGGAGDNVSNKSDVDGRYHLVARVDLPQLVQGVEFLISNGDSFTSLGDGERVGRTDTYELYWGVPQEAGTYTLRAQIIGTETFDERTIRVNNTMEAVEITQPPNGKPLGFSERSTVIFGTASGGAEGVDVYYTKAAAKDVHDSAAWIQCGTSTLTGRSEVGQEFRAECELKAFDEPWQVRAVAAVAADCDPNFGCSAQRLRESGDAHRLIGWDEDALSRLRPARARPRVGTCRRLTFSVTDRAGQPIPSVNVDVRLRGRGRFCKARGRHFQSVSDLNGRLVVGVRSWRTGRSSVKAWMDPDENDIQDNEETFSISRLRWRR